MSAHTEKELYSYYSCGKWYIRLLITYWNGESFEVDVLDDKHNTAI